MVRPEATREALRKQLLEAYVSEFDGGIETWKMLEGKAQASVAVSGIFFAAAFAYVREATPLSGIGRIILMACLGSLLVSVASAILSLRVRQVAVPPHGSFLTKIIEDLMRLPDARLNDETIARFESDQITQWTVAVKATTAANVAKAAHVWRSQMSLVIAMVMAAVFTMMRIL